jgi:tetratricopeptide (TPR) repeat protein
MFRLLTLSPKAWLVTSLVIWIFVVCLGGFYCSSIGLREEYIIAFIVGVIFASPIFLSIISNNLSNKNLSLYLLVALNLYSSVYALLMILYLRGDLNFLAPRMDFLDPVVRFSPIEKFSGTDRKRILELMNAGKNDSQDLLFVSDEIQQLLIKYPDSHSVNTIYALYLVAIEDLNRARLEFNKAAQKAAKFGDTDAQIENLLFIIIKIDVQRDDHESGLKICQQILSLSPNNQQAKKFEKYFNNMIDIKQIEPR